MAKTKFFRVATSGATIDGRTIKDQDLVDMAATYNPATYQARVNLEHWLSPNPDSVFGAYGDVLALKTEPVTLNVGGKDEQRTGLYAEIDAHDPLVALNDKRQKLFTSVEVVPNFAGSGKAYLGGLAFTDNPASLGTEMMKFRAALPTGSPMHFRQYSPDALHTAPEETAFELFATPVGMPGADPDPQTNGIMDAIRRALSGFTGAPAAPAPVAPPAAPIAPATDPAIVAGFAAVRQGLEQFASLAATLRTDLAALRADFTGAQAETATLKAALEKLPASSFKPRPAATGGGGERAADDEIL
jgi:hypothetical protein